MKATIERTTLNLKEQAVLNAELADEMDPQSRLDLACLGDCGNCVFERVCNL